MAEAEEEVSLLGESALFTTTFLGMMECVPDAMIMSNSNRCGEVATDAIDNNPPIPPRCPQQCGDDSRIGDVASVAELPPTITD